MKLKSFALLAMSGLIAGSIAYIAPAMADYTNNSPTQTNPSDNSTAQNLLDPNANVGALPNNNQNYNAGNSNASNNNYTNNYNNNAPANTDNEQGSPDTATGDDDY